MTFSLFSLVQKKTSLPLKKRAACTVFNNKVKHPTIKFTLVYNYYFISAITQTNSQPGVNKLSIYPQLCPWNLTLFLLITKIS